MPENVLDVIINFTKKGTGDTDAKTGLKGLNDAFTDLTGVSLGSVTAIGLAVGAIKLLGDAIGFTVERAMVVKDFAMALGTTTKEASKLILIGDDLRVEVGTMQSAFRFALDKGFNPTIEGLVKMSAEMMALLTPQERMSYAVDHFGRGPAVAMMRFLELGPGKLEEMSVALEGNAAVMSDKNVKAADDYRLALDDLKDMWEALKISGGVEVFPILTKALGGFKAGVEGLSQGLGLLGDFWEATKIMWSGGTAQEMADAFRDQTDAIAGATAGLVPYSNYTGDASVSTELLTGNLKELHLQASRNRIAMQEFAQQGVTQLDNALDSLVSESIAGYTSSMSEAMVMQAAWDLAMGNITQATYDQILANAPLIDNFEQMGQLLKDGKVDWSYYFQAIKDGKVTNEELISALIATGMSAEDARKKVLGLTDAINAMPERKQIIIDMDYNIANPPPGGWGPAPIAEAEGGEYNVTKPTLFIAGEAGPERAIFIPQGGGGGSTSNTFNIQLAGTGQASADILSTVRLLELLYG
jgi:hypothetical protein